MLRSLLIYFSKAAWMKNIVMNMRLARRVVSRFVAGETLAEAIQAIQQLNNAGLLATVDQLGEDTTTADEARQTAAEITAILDGIREADVKSSLSLKLTQIGLALDEDLCTELLGEIVKHAAAQKTFVRIDMEDTPYTDATIRVYWRIRNEHHLDNVGMVIQSYLYRSEGDTAELLEGATRIRLVKGAYKEPAELAYPKKADVDQAFDDLARMMMDAAAKPSSPAIDPSGAWPPIPAIATHDEARIQFAKAYAAGIGLPKEKLEFQMLYGIRSDLQARLQAEGYPVRVYVPFGRQWYPYFMRRLAERPANLWFFMSSLFR